MEADREPGETGATAGALTLAGGGRSAPGGASAAAGAARPAACDGPGPGGLGLEPPPAWTPEEGTAAPAGGDVDGSDGSRRGGAAGSGRAGADAPPGREEGAGRVPAGEGTTASTVATTASVSSSKSGGGSQPPTGGSPEGTGAGPPWSDGGWAPVDALGAGAAGAPGSRTGGWTGAAGGAAGGTASASGCGEGAAPSGGLGPRGRGESSARPGGDPDRAAEEIAATGLGKESFVSAPGRLSRAQSFSSFSFVEDGGGLTSAAVVCGQPPEEGGSRG